MDTERFHESWVMFKCIIFKEKVWSHTVIPWEWFSYWSILSAVDDACPQLRLLKYLCIRTGSISANIHPH